MLHKIYIAVSNGAQKIDPWISTIFWINVFENITDNNTDLITISIAFLFFVWVIISLDKHLRFCSNSTPGFFRLPRMFQNSGKASINIHFLMEQSLPTSSNTFWGTPFLEKGPPKITEGGPFHPHWPISRINPGVSLSSAQASLCCREAEDRDKTKFEGDNDTFSLFPSSLFQLVITEGYRVQVTTI